MALPSTIHMFEPTEDNDAWLPVVSVAYEADLHVLPQRYDDPLTALRLPAGAVLSLSIMLSMISSSPWRAPTMACRKPHLELPKREKIRTR